MEIPLKFFVLVLFAFFLTSTQLVSQNQYSNKTFEIPTTLFNNSNLNKIHIHNLGFVNRYSNFYFPFRRNIYRWLNKTENISYVLTYFIILCFTTVFTILGFSFFKRRKTSRNSLKTKSPTYDKFLSSNEKQLLRIISHELINPFNMMVGYARILKEDCNSLPSIERDKIINLIYDYSLHNYEQVRHILDWARTNQNTISVNKVKINVKDLIDDILVTPKLMAKAKNIRIKNSVPKDLVLDADEQILRLIVSNLLQNAIKYSPSNEEIEVVVQDCNNKIQFTVMDKGKGILAKKLNSIQPDSCSDNKLKAKKKSRLGLKICNQLAILHNGSLFFDTNKKGIGTKAFFEIPA